MEFVTLSFGKSTTKSSLSRHFAFPQNAQVHTLTNYSLNMFLIAPLSEIIENERRLIVRFKMILPVF